MSLKAQREIIDARRNDSLNEAIDALGKTAFEIKAQRDRLAKAVRPVVDGYDYNPGSSDLDDEQPIHVSMTLGDYRRIRSLIVQIEHP